MSERMRRFMSKVEREVILTLGVLVIKSSTWFMTKMPLENQVRYAERGNKKMTCSLLSEAMSSSCSRVRSIGFTWLYFNTQLINRIHRETEASSPLRRFYPFEVYITKNV